MLVGCSIFDFRCSVDVSFSSFRDVRIRRFSMFVGCSMVDRRVSVHVIFSERFDVGQFIIFASARFSMFDFRVSLFPKCGLNSYTISGLHG